jgi:hypothetical protein
MRVIKNVIEDFEKAEQPFLSAVLMLASFSRVISFYAQK